MSPAPTLTAADLFPEISAQDLDLYLSRVDSHLPSLYGACGGPVLPTVVQLPPRGPEPVPFGRLFEGLSSSLAALDPFRLSADGAVRDARKAIVEDSISEVLMRPLVELLGTARTGGELVGGDPHERYHHFQELLAADLGRLWGGYPQAGEALRARVGQGDAFLIQLAQCLADDADELRDLGVAADDPVISIVPSGDPHNMGRRVCLLTTRSGLRFVYKPRPVDGEWAYLQLTRAVAPFFGELPAARVVRREGYGYMEFVSAQEAPAPRELAAQTGRLGALLYALNCRDLHFENVLAGPDGPTPIDMESMLHPHRIGQPGARLEAKEARQLLDCSVHGVGVLPMVVSRSGEAGYYDVGFLGRGRVVEGGAFRRHGLHNAYTDEMQLAFIKPPMEGDVVEAPVDEVRDCSDAFTEAFSGAYRLILDNREQFLAAVGEHCADLALRYLHNPTMLYAQVLATLSSAPAASSVELGVLLALRIGLNSLDNARIVAAEAGALLRQNIPYFVINSSEETLRDDNGTELGRFAASPLALVEAKILGMSEADLAEQVRLIRGAFCATIPDESTAPTRGSALGVAARPLSLTDVLRDTALDLADRALIDRFEHLPHTWIGPLAAIESDRPWPPGVLGYDLYTGRLGVALGLARAGRALDDARCVAAATQVFDASARILTDQSYDEDTMGSLGRGAYTGLPGVVWALDAAGRVLERRDWSEAARSSYYRLAGTAHREPYAKRADTISGVIGSWWVARALGVTGPVALQERQDLIDDVRSGAWAGMEAWHQSGAAHGTAGLLRALATVGADAEVLRIVLAHLDTFWDEAENNWHTNDATGRFAQGWCHGRGGILLGLAAAAAAGVASRQIPTLEELTADLIAEGTGFTLTHCHGDFGTWDVLRTLARQGVPGAADGAQRVLAALDAERIGAKLADPHSRYSLNDGLLVGRSGVLVHVADRVDPSLAISVLNLEVLS